MGQGKRRRKRSESDYDGAWKETLRCYFRLVLEKFFPGIAGVVDWESGFDWADKELSQILGQVKRRNYTADVLARVRLTTGHTSAILLHVEVQSDYEVGFAERLALYNSGLSWIFKQRVVTLGLLADLREGWIPNEHQFRLAEFETRMRFPVCKLISHLETDWVGDDSLPVQVARAQIAALRTARAPEARYAAKWQLVRNMYAMGYNRERVRELFRLIDWMMHLREDLEVQFKQELHKLEEEMDMPYITSVERLAREEGKEEGKVEGKAEGGAAILIKLLVKLFGELPTALEGEIRGLTSEQQAVFAESVLDFGSLEEVKVSLAALQAEKID